MEIWWIYLVDYIIFLTVESQVQTCLYHGYRHLSTIINNLHVENKRIGTGQTTSLVLKVSSALLCSVTKFRERFRKLR